MTLPAPTVMGPSSFAPAPMVTPSPTVGCRLPCTRLFPPRVTPWYISTSSPTSAVAPMTTPMPWSMKSRRPMRAPGWISTPVSARPACASSRAAKRRRRRHSACDTRCSHTACRPG
ncbi:hypothetical protein BC477_00605 [Clavibacter michiganensis subsp. michiganensis]|uniref:Uncharacterized protein n=1 Tax=Clavibacter michiganensis subsp. michiganensis TaxID=33013 RepID=A0A251XFV5_CLAMM|nr:hypothetical protein BC477_00605 [Clavibacter michiganensis subsp. michiganensis]OUE00924.1 hypothetical protein CMMCAS07_15910 [Clavibacter michiganensis subsp. michiganensis]